MKHLWTIDGTGRRPGPRARIAAVLLFLLAVPTAAAAQDLAIDDVVQAEGNTGTRDYVFTVTLSPASGATVTVDWATGNSSATTYDNDYVAGSGTLTFLPGQTARTFTVQVIGDTKLEGDEHFNVVLSNAFNATITNVGASGNITNDDVGIALNPDVSHVEGNSGLVDYTFTVSLSGPYPLTIMVDWSTANGSANTLDDDYVAASGTLTFLPGETSHDITVQAVGDTKYEGNENFNVVISNAVNATITDVGASGTILNDDVTVSIGADVSHPEGNSGLVDYTFPVSLSASYPLTITVDWSTANGSANTSDNDYVAGSGTLTFLPGETAHDITVQAVGDTKIEGDESFFVVLSNAVNATIADSGANATILNDDFLPGVSIGDVMMVEGDAGFTSFDFAVSLDSPSTGTVTVGYGTSSGSASAPGDFTATSGTLSFAPGETMKTIPVPVAGETLFENDESFSVVLFNPSGAIIGDGNGVGTIQNDDVLEAAIDDVAAAETDSGTTTFAFTISLSNASQLSSGVSWSITGVSASAGIDFVAGSGTLTFAPGQTSLQVPVGVVGDTDHEIDETFTVDLSSPVTLTLTDAQGLGTILDDDAVCSPHPRSVTDLAADVVNGGADLLFTWTDTADSDHYLLYEHASPAEPYTGPSGMASSGTMGIETPVPSGTAYFLLAAANAACGPGPRHLCAHHVCDAGGRLDSGCDPCAAAVCTADPSCCETGWTAACVAMVATVCGQTCN